MLLYGVDVVLSDVDIKVDVEIWKPFKVEILKLILGVDVKFYSSVDVKLSPSIPFSPSGGCRRNFVCANILYEASSLVLHQCSFYYSTYFSLF